MKITRRQFLKGAAAAGVMLSVPLKFGVRSARAFYQSTGIPLFVTPLRDLGTIPVAAPDVDPAPITGVTHYTINISQFEDQITPNLGPTTLWGYQPKNILQGPLPQAHLGGIIVGQKGHPIQITFNNMLPTSNLWGQIHPLPVDTSIPGANTGFSNVQNRAAVHLHGGLVPWISDGGPFDWFDPAGGHGDSFLNNLVLNPGAAAGQAEYYYPLNQSARFMWYHDHAVGITRLNAYAGIASGMLIRDKFEGFLRNFGLPDFIENGGREIPLIFQDKIFVDANTIASDITWPGPKTSGSLWYAHTYDTDRWELVSGPSSPPPDPSSIPEFFGDTMLVNGASYPTVGVEARRYRLRLLNACNARFLNLQLYEADSSKEGITLDPDTGFPTNTPFVNGATGKQTWLQIGTEGGFLALPAQIPSNQPLRLLVPPNGTTGQTNPSKVVKSLLVAPAERPDVIVDFTKYEGKSIILYNDAPAPFPSGDDRNDYFPGYNLGSGVNGVGNPANTDHTGVGPNSRVLMRFDVGPALSKDKPLFISGFTPTFLDLDPFLLPPFVHEVPKFFKTRFLTLNEYHDDFGRLIQILGNGLAPKGSPYFGTALYADYPGQSTPTGVGSTEEDVTNGAVEVWEVYNTTADVHPMHFHLVNVQVVNRQLFVQNQDGSPVLDSYGHPQLTGPIIPADKNETGWKETVPMYPGTVTRVIMKFDLPLIVDKYGRPITTAKINKFRLPITKGKPPNSPRTGGAEYVWHCHILEHEEHDMMHALVVT